MYIWVKVCIIKFAHIKANLPLKFSLCSPLANDLFTKNIKKPSIKGYNYKHGKGNGSSKKSQERPTHLILGGLLAYLGLDEDSKKERRYEKEVENNEETDFDEKLRNILRPAMMDVQVNVEMRVIPNLGNHHPEITFVYKCQ